MPMLAAVLLLLMVVPLVYYLLMMLPLVYYLCNIAAGVLFV